MAVKIKIIVFGGRILGYKGLELLNSYSDKINIELFVPHTNLGEKGSDWNPPILPLAKRNGIKILKTKTLKNQKIINKINRIKPDLILNLFCNRIIPKDILNIPKLGTINFHYGKLPKYRGRFIVNNVILNNERDTYATVHYMDEGIDTGDIIYEKKVKISSDDTAKTLYFKCTKAALGLLQRLIKTTILRKNFPRKKQVGAAGYFPFKEPNNCFIDLKWNQGKIERFIRAMTFEPISKPFLKVGNLKFKVLLDENPKND